MKKLLLYSSFYSSRVYGSRKNEMKKITKSSVNDRGISKKTTTVVPFFYYYIKDINSKENFYSELGKTNMEEHSKSHIPFALKYFFKVLKDNYKW